MIKKLQDGFSEGVNRLKWFSDFFSERVKIEMAVFRLFHQSEHMKRTRTELIQRIGERVLECRSHPEKNLLKDAVIAEALAELEAIDRKIDDVRLKASEISKGGE